MGERRGARFGRVAVAGSPGPDAAVLTSALDVEGFAVASDDGPAAVGLYCVDLSVGPASCFDDGGPQESAAKQGISELHSRCDAVAIVGVGLERCQQWPARIAALARAADPDGGAAVFAVALRVADAGDAAASGVPELVEWAVERSDAVAAVELSRRAAAERLSGLRVGSAAVRSWAGGTVHAGFRELAAAGQEAAAGMRTTEAARFVEWITRSADGLERSLVAAVAEQTAHLRATALVGLQAYSPTADPTPSPPQRPSSGMDRHRRAWGAEDAVIVLLGVSSGLGVGRLVAGSISGWIPGWMAVICAVLIGLAVAGGAVALRRRVVLRARARAWVAE
ncbi:MAG TPA: hypothetical protein PKG94_05380, partial [Gordonia sp. (in: high G+C Gram-positive bacteria)]|nr:hypothetical protein [Gordonia sp. (in: high G+C Gram-positive bacteria)]